MRFRPVRGRCTCAPLRHRVLRRAPLAFAALLAYVALLFVRPQEWFAPLRGVPLMDYVVGAALVTWLAQLRHSPMRIRSPLQNLLMLGLFLATLMSHVRHTFLELLINTFREFGKVVLIYFLVASLVSSVARVKIVVRIIIIGCLFLTVHGIMQATSDTHTGFGGHVAMEQGEYQVDDMGRMHFVRDGLLRVRGFGIFSDPNDLALILVTCLPFLISKALDDKEARMPVRLGAAALTVPILYCIYHTNSRGGWLALGVMVGTYFLLHMRRKKLALIVASLALCALFVFGPSRMSGISVSGAAARGRVAAWGAGNRMLKRAPIFGVGLGRFTEFADEGRAAHNSLVGCYAEIGLFGYFFWLALVAATAKDAYALSRLSKSDEPEEEDEEWDEWASADEESLPAAAPVPEGLPEEGEDYDYPVDGAGLPSPPTEEQVEETAELARLARAGLAALAGFMAAAFFLSRTFHLPLYVLFGLFAAMRPIHDRDLGKLPLGFAARDLRYVLAAELLSVALLWMMARVMM